MKPCFCIMGIARSGTSLACKLFTESVNNVFCMNETEIDIDKVPRLLSETRRKLLAGEPVPNRWDGSALQSDTVRCPTPVSERVVHGYDADVVMGIKMAMRFERAVNQGLKVVAVVRDPVYAIASWRQAGDIVWNHVTDGDMNQMWVYEKIKFERSSRLERQCELWEHYARQIQTVLVKHPDKVKLWRYEDFTVAPQAFVGDVAEFIGCSPKTAPDLSCFNLPWRFNELDRIADAVERLCPSRGGFDYA